jgi:hypothetical protein
MDSDFGRIARFYASHVNALTYDADGNVNGPNKDDFFIMGRPIAQLETLLSFLISQLDHDLRRPNFKDRRTQQHLEEILNNIRLN